MQTNQEMDLIHAARNNIFSLYEKKLDKHLNDIYLVS